MKNLYQISIIIIFFISFFLINDLICQTIDTINSNPDSALSTVAKSHPLNLTIDRIISLLSSIAALLTAILVFFTLREMQKQRKSAYKPEIIIKSKTYRSYINKQHKIKYNILDPADISKSFKIDENIDSLKGTILFLELYNIGFASAKSIKVSWSFNKEKMEDFRKSLNKFKNSPQISINNNVWEITTNTGNKLSTFQFNYEYDYILPVNTSPDPTILYVPNFYIEIYSIFTRILFENNLIKNEPKNMIIPPLELKLSYSDIENNIHEKKYLITHSIIFSSITTFADGNCVFTFVYNIL